MNGCGGEALQLLAPVVVMSTTTGGDELLGPDGVAGLGLSIANTLSTNATTGNPKANTFSVFVISRSSRFATAWNPPDPSRRSNYGLFLSGPGFMCKPKLPGPLLQVWLPIPIVL